MHVRRNLNLLLQNSSHYRVVKVTGGGRSMPLPPEVILDDTMLTARISPTRKHAWLIAAPKSGSTWLSVLLEKLLGWPVVSLFSGCERREQEPDIRQLLRFPDQNIFSPHQHCRASRSTTELIQHCRIQPIIQVRNIHDTVISFREHCLREGLRMSMAYIDDEFFRLDPDRQLDFVIDLVLPWYFNFYASWLQVEGLSPRDLLFVNYDELRQDAPAILSKILHFLGEHRTAAQIREAMEQTEAADTRKNKAVSGRGDGLLNERHKARIRELRRHYPHIDFSPVGL